MLTDIKTLIKTNFSYLWISQILSQVSINIMNFLLLIELFARTSSTIATSFLWVAYALPAILIGPIAAPVVDIFDKRKILVMTNLFQALVIFLYAVAGERLLFLPYGVAFMYSMLNQFYLPSESATVPVLVKKVDLPRANGLFFLTQQLALVVGFGFAGPLNHWLGFKTSLLLCSFFLFIAFFSVLLLPRIKSENVLPTIFEEAFLDFFRKILDGYHFIKNNNSVLFPFLLLMTLQVLLAIVMVNTPLIAKDILGINLNLTGLVVIAPAGIGSAIGALTIPHLLKKGERKKTTINNSLFLFAVSILVVSLVIPTLSPLVRILTSIIAIVIVGYAFVGILIPAQTFLQEKTPGGYTGRVFGNFWFMTTVATILPVIFSGTISEVLGIRVLLMFMGFMTLSFLIFSKRILIRFPLK